jgi:hypothetical protein
MRHWSVCPKGHSAEGCRCSRHLPPWTLTEMVPLRHALAWRTRDVIAPSDPVEVGRCSDHVESFFAPQARLRPPTLDDVLTGLRQRFGQPGGKASGSFQRPDPTARRVVSGPVEHALVARTVGRSLDVGTGGTGGGVSTARSMVSRSRSPPMTFS